MVSHNLRHQKRDLVRRVKFARLLACICRKIRNQVFIDKAQHIVVLLAIHRNILDEMEQVADRLCLRVGTIAQLGKPRLQSVEHLVKDFFVRGIDKAAESRKRIANVRHVEVTFQLEPSRKQVLVRDEIADVLLDILDDFFVIFGNGIQVSVGVTKTLKILDLFIRKELVEDETKDVILVFVRFNL